MIVRQAAISVSYQPMTNTSIAANLCTQWISKNDFIFCYFLIKLPWDCECLHRIATTRTSYENTSNHNLGDGRYQVLFKCNKHKDIRFNIFSITNSMGKFNMGLVCMFAYTGIFWSNINKLQLYESACQVLSKYVIKQATYGISQILHKNSMGNFFLIYSATG